jgi:NADH:ubiquinone oxidoreductase subunit E
VTEDRETSGRRYGNPVPGGVLLLAHELWTSGQTSPEAHEEAARSLGISTEDFETVREFHRRLVSRAHDEPLVLCRGVSCRMHGADSFHSALKSGLDSAGVLGRTMDVLCLSQCPHGPNLKVQQMVLCTGTAAVIADDRPWRPITAGPRPVVDAAPPS